MGRLGILNSSVPSCAPIIGSRSLPSSLKVRSFIQTFCANSNCRMRLAQMTKAAMPRSTPSSGSAFRQRRPVGRPSSDHPPTVHVVPRVARIYPANVRAKRHGVAVRVHVLVGEVVVALKIGPERRVVLLGREYERRAAAPAPHQLRRDEFLLLVRVPCAQEVTELADVLLEPPIGHEAAVPGEDFRLRAVGRDRTRPGSRG